MPPASRAPSATDLNLSRIQADANIETDATFQVTQSSSKADAIATTTPITDARAIKISAESLTNVVQPVAIPQKTFVADDSITTPGLIEQRGDTASSVHLTTSGHPTTDDQALSSANNPVAVQADCSSPLTQNQTSILQRTTAGWQNVLNELSDVRAAATVEAVDSNNENPSNRQGANQESSSSEGCAPGNAAVASIGQTTAGALGPPSQAVSKNSLSDLAGIAGSASPAPPAQQVLHSPNVSTTQSAEVPAAELTQNTGTKPMFSPSQPLPASPSLPASLSEMMRASELYQHMGNGEMHVAMQTELLGTIDLHATMRQSTLTATIGVQRADVQNLLANDLPALQHALADQHFHVEHIAVLDSSIGAHSGAAGEQPRQQNPLPSSPVARGFGRSDLRRAKEFEVASVPTVPSGSGAQVAKLSIHV